ncbi:MAG TPA: nucleotidyltransferase domain-containing protein [Candidatus Limnocylindria bacterium]|nr:nucleotidyltransferase domain-containing protein [Candidatus Limnocylindria bacterium]
MSPLEGKIAEALADSTVPLASAYLYGSQAEGRAHRESDVDVGILLARSGAGTAQDRFERRVRLTSLLMERLHTDGVDVVILNEAPPLLGRRIVTRGRRVLCNDAEADHAYVRDVQLRAADLEPFLRRTARTKLASIGR